jgi:hypothetical protein
MKSEKKREKECTHSNKIIGSEKNCTKNEKGRGNKQTKKKENKKKNHCSLQKTEKKKMYIMFGRREAKKIKEILKPYTDN